RSMRGRLTRATAAAELQAAVDAGEIEVMYAPVLSVQDGQLVAVRAELHWNATGPFNVSSRELIAALEDTGLIVRVGAWLITEACRQARRWRLVNPLAAVQVVVPVPSRLLAQA